MTGLQIITKARQVDNQTYSLKTPVKSGGSVYYDSGDVIRSSSTLTYCRVVETNPDTGSLWSATDVNDAEFGITAV